LAEGKELLDGSLPSSEWARRAPKLCVFPVGTFEQHSRHLPLLADDIEAQYFGEFLARELGAALLPVLNYGTSLEQTGFRGTVSLRPETLMQIVRDVADEVERQGFETMILLNSHGGNYSLGPVVRDINRRDRSLKILLVDWFAFADRSFLDAAKMGRGDLHAGEFETSLIMVLRPELVRPDGPDMVPAVQGFVQPDLNTFGVGYVAPEGAYGLPSLASREKGERLVASIKTNMLRHVRERLAWLAQRRGYTGKGRNNA